MVIHGGGIGAALRDKIGRLRIELEDVAKPGEVEFPKEQTIKTTYKTYEGLIVEAELFVLRDSGGSDSRWGGWKSTSF